MDEIFQRGLKEVKMRDFLSLVCYMLGDWISRSPLANFEIGGTAYQKLMKWSVELDRNDKIWTRQD